jgi:predicted nucleotidyltransferase
VIAMGKLGSFELNYSSDVDLLLLFDPDTLSRRPRDDAGEAAVRIGRRLIELLQREIFPTFRSSIPFSLTILRTAIIRLETSGMQKHFLRASISQ